MLAARRANTSSRRSATWRSASLRSRLDSRSRYTCPFTWSVSWARQRAKYPVPSITSGSPSLSNPWTTDRSGRGTGMTAPAPGGAGPRKAPLAVVGQPAPGRVGLLEHRVDDVPDMPDPVVVRAVVDEKPQIDVDLVGREAGPVRDVHREEHVVDQRREIGPELGHVPARLVQHLLADLGDAPDLPAPGLGGETRIRVGGPALDEDTGHGDSPVRRGLSGC